MSHAVLRGKPTPAQLYLDGVLDSILLEKGIKPDPTTRANVTATEILLHSLKERPKDIFLINAATGAEITNEQHLKKTISLSRALTAKGAKGKHALLLMRNHEDSVATYFATLFTGLIPFMMDPNGTVYELTHFLELIKPSFVFYDQEFDEALKEARKGCKDLKTEVLMVNGPGVLQQFTDGFSDDIDSFQVSPAGMDDATLMLPTSGSTGMPKAAIQTQRGLVSHLPCPWTYHSKFPTPTARVMVLTSLQWVTFTMFVTSSVANHVTIITTPNKITAEHVIEILEKYRPTWGYLAPSFAVALVPLVRSDQLSSLETLFLLGSPTTPELMVSLKEKLPKNIHLCDGYGTTETHGFIAIPDREAPQKCNGWVLNHMIYKIVDDQGQEVGPNAYGELWVKGDNAIKGYLKNKKSYEESFTPDGWYMTGDVFHIDENERLTFTVRKKFAFKFMGSQVAPEEVERVIGSVPGVYESVVCLSDKGPVAAVVLEPQATVTREQIKNTVAAPEEVERVIGSVPGVYESVVCLSDKGPVAAVVLEPQATVTREQIKNTVAAALSDHKRLHGGIAFVPSLPHTHSGKLQRSECSELIAELYKNGECY